MSWKDSWKQGERSNKPSNPQRYQRPIRRDKFGVRIPASINTPPVVEWSETPSQTKAAGPTPLTNSGEIDKSTTSIVPKRVISSIANVTPKEPVSATRVDSKKEMAVAMQVMERTASAPAPMGASFGSSAPRSLKHKIGETVIAQNSKNLSFPLPIRDNGVSEILPVGEDIEGECEGLLYRNDIE